LIEAGKLERGGRGSECSLDGGAAGEGRWLLFTDADTVHEPGDLRRAIDEAEKHKWAC